MSRFVVLAVCLITSLSCGKLFAKSPPNVVVILTDDQGWGDLSVHGNKNLSTPNIDSLARDGALFERFYVCPVCSPTRAEFLTGRFHDRGGVYSTSTGGERLDLDEATVVQSFQSAGYATAAFGKWHNGMQYPYHPNARGFDEFYGFCSGHWGDYFSPPLEHNGKLVQGNGFIIDDFTDHAIDFIEGNQDKPFFCYLPYNTPHSPMQVPDRFYKKFDGMELSMPYHEPKLEEIPKTLAALAMCENIDWNVGRVLEKLDALSLSKNTIVVYFTDNGPNSYRWNGHMRGRKGSTDEGGTRVPCLIRWSGHIDQGMKVKQLAGAYDLMPTLADLAGVKVTSSKPLDGDSLKPILLNEKQDVADRIVVTNWRNVTSVRDATYHLDSKGKLYDLVRDPGQRRDITDQHPDVVSRLSSVMEEWKRDVLAEVVDDDRPFPLGYAEFPVTHLPARDGIPHGGIERSAKAPNCSYFTNWKALDDSITWDVEVATAGVYEVTVCYTCPPKDVGSVVELSLGDAKKEFTISEPFESTLVGAEHDRSPRKSESLVKEFRPLSLGRLTIRQGRAELKLQAKMIAGTQLMDVRYVVLTLIQ